MPSLSYGCTFSHLCASGWYFSSPKQSKKTGLEQSWPFLKRNFHSQGPRFSCCCYRIIYDYGIFTKNLSRLTCLYRYDLIVPQIAQALPSESYSQFLKLPAPPVWITCPTALGRVSTQLLGSLCNRFCRQHGCSGVVLLRQQEEMSNDPLMWTNCESTLRVTSNNWWSQLLLRDLGQVQWWKSSAMLCGREKHSL